MKRKHPEDDLQRAVCKLLAYSANPGVVWFAIPNGGKRSRVEAAIMAGLGVTPGAPDLAFLVPPGRACFLELKAKGRKIKKGDSQDTMRTRIRLAGGFSEEADSLDRAIIILLRWHVLRDGIYQLSE